MVMRWGLLDVSYPTTSSKLIKITQISPRAMYCKQISTTRRKSWS